MEHFLFEVFMGLNLSKVLGETQGHMLDYNKHPSMGGAVECRPNSSKPKPSKAFVEHKDLTYASRYNPHLEGCVSL
jgi:hypothetical protein